MTAVDIDEQAASIRKVANAAHARHWLTWTTHARTHDGVESVAVRFRRREGPGVRHCYGVWTLGTTATGKASAKWRGGATSDGKHLPTVAALNDYLGLGA